MSILNNKRALILSAITAVCVFGCFGAYVFNSTPKDVQTPKTPQYQFVVAKEEIKKGSVVKEEDIEIKDFPMDINGTYKATGELVGRTAKQDIVAGKPIMKAFIKEIVVKETNDEGIQPDEGFRAVPVLVKKSGLPPYISTSDRFDLTTKENTMVIENLRILNILDPTKDESNKMIILEIKTSDVSDFVKHLSTTKGLIFLQKNPGDYGEYKFTDLERLRIENELAQEKRAMEELIKKTSNPIPPAIENNEIPNISDIAPSVFKTPEKTREVEIIVGNSKTKMEFSD